MDVNDLPLQELFTRLREAGLPIGIDEYKSVLRAMQAGFGISDRIALKRLCQTLWIKSIEERQLFEYHFEQVMPLEAVVPETETQPTLSSHRRLIHTLLLRALRVLPFGTMLRIYAVHLKKESSSRKRVTRYAILSTLAVAIVFGVRSSLKEETPKNPPSSPTAIPNTTPKIIGKQTATLIPTPPQTPQPNTNNNQSSTQTTSSNTNSNQSNWIFWLFPSLIVLGGGYVFVKWVTTRKATSPSAPELTQNKDEAQIAQAVVGSSPNNIPNNRFLKSAEYFPVTDRQMKQIWRYLRRPVRQGSLTELDVEATVNQIGQQGILLEPVLRPSRVNSAQMLLLIDQDGSMVPFGELSRRLAKTALRGGRLGKASIYYFHNCPIEYLYHDPNLLEAELVSDVVSYVCSERTAILIFSDAGAARGGYSKERYELTKDFLTQLKEQVRYIAWLNPMPQARWKKTTANEIASLVSMFELSRRGLQDAIGVLRGRPTNFEGRKL